MGVSVQHEEGLRGLGRAYGFVEAVVVHVAFTEAADAMGIDGQYPTLKMARGATHLAQSDLQALAVSDSSSPEKLVDGRVAGEEGKAVSQLEDLLVQAAAQAQARGAKRRLVDQLQSQTRFDAFRALRGPATYQVPGSQP